MTISDLDLVFGVESTIANRESGDCAGKPCATQAPMRARALTPCADEVNLKGSPWRTPFPARIGQAHVLGGHACVVRGLKRTDAVVSVSPAANLDGMLILRLNSGYARRAVLLDRSGDLARLRFIAVHTEKPAPAAD